MIISCMSKKDNILAVTMAAVLVISIALTFYRTMIKKDFEVVNIEAESILPVGNQ